MLVVIEAPIRVSLENGEPYEVACFIAFSIRKGCMHHRPVVLKLDLHSTVIDTDVSSQGRLYCTFLCGDPSGIIKMPTSDKAGTVSFDLVALRLMPSCLTQQGLGLVKARSYHQLSSQARQVTTKIGRRMEIPNVEDSYHRQQRLSFAGKPVLRHQLDD